jgi:tripartite-type tricarboxylate transporter receptor subunit TctC
MLSKLAKLLCYMTALVVASLPVAAQTSHYPNRPIKIVVPFAPGGGVDAVARLMAERLGSELSVPVIVENRAGASGTVGGGFVQRASPDGYTLLLSSNTHAMAKQVLADAPYDPLKDFTSVARIGQAPLMTVMAADRPQTSLAEIAKAIKANPRAWTAGVPALGSPGHIATIAFMQLTGAKDLTIVPYRGTAPALNDVVGGHIQLQFDAMLVLLPMAKSGKVKGIAITSSKRTSLAPDIPSAAESGVPGLDVSAWYAIWGPKGMPQDVVEKLNKACADATRELEKQGKLAAIGVEPVYETPEQFRAFTEKEVARNTELLNSVGFKPE